MIDSRDTTLLETGRGNFVSTRNACKLCSPLGASIVFRGIENCVPLIHGSQGCSTYIRRYIISHFREPIDIASSNFSESSAIFGGGENLHAALDNVIRAYRPDAVGIATTCLSETIGDDIRLFIGQYRSRRAGMEIPSIIHASTPSYRGTHMDGFHEAIRSSIISLAEGGDGDDTLNLVPGFLSPADLRHLKEILSDFGIRYTLFPDYSETLDGESWTKCMKLSPGGTPVSSIRRMGNAGCTIRLGRSLAEAKCGAAFLREKFGVPSLTLGLPFGINETDRFFSALENFSNIKTPEKHTGERGRLVDAYIDGHKYVFGKRAVLYGEEDFVTGMASFLDEIGMLPVLCATGSGSGTFTTNVRAVLGNCREEPVVVGETDFARMLELCGELKPDIVIGSSKGYFLSRRLGIPLIRAGFPVHDRIGGARVLHACYRGAQRLFDAIVNALLEHRQDSTNIGYSYM